MMKRVSQALRDADAVLAIVDCSLDPKQTLEGFQALLEARQSRDLPLAVVIIFSASFLKPRLHERKAHRMWKICLRPAMTA